MLHDELEKSKQYALIIGTNYYKEGKPTWLDLDNAENDAKSINQLLADKFHFETKLLLSPKTEEVEKAILNYQNKLNEGDRFLLYIAGHGDYDEENFDDGFLVFSDSKILRKDPTRSSYLQYRKLNGMLNALKAQHVAIILDVCFGGSFNSQLRNKEKYRGKVEEEIITAKFLKNKMNKISRVYLTSGALERVPDGTNGHSPFCNAIISFLSEEQHQLFTLSDLHQQTKRSISESMYGSFGKDELGSEFIFSSSSSQVLSDVDTSIDNDINLVVNRGVNKDYSIIIYIVTTLLIVIILFLVLRLLKSNKNKEIEITSKSLEATQKIKLHINEGYIRIDDLIIPITEGNEDELRHQLSLYEIHSKNLKQIEIASAKYEENPPSILIHRKDSVEKEITEIIKTLKSYNAKQ